MFFLKKKQFLKSFPFVDFSSPMFLGACAGLLVNHWLWIVFFREELQYRVPQVCVSVCVSVCARAC